jgi:hypothetical protein
MLSRVFSSYHHTYNLRPPKDTTGNKETKMSEHHLFFVKHSVPDKERTVGTYVFLVVSDTLLLTRYVASFPS